MSPDSSPRSASFRIWRFPLPHWRPVRPGHALPGFSQTQMHTWYWLKRRVSPIPGGWVIDQEFADQMGSVFLLAHGMGKPALRDAHIMDISILEAGISGRVWVRTRDWVAPWKAPGASRPVQAGGKREAAGNATFGTEEGEQSEHWQHGGNIKDWLKG